VNSYVTQYFGSDGPNAYEASLVEDDGGTLVWTMHSDKDRFTGTFSDGRDVIGPLGRARLGLDLAAWMDISLTKEAS
jgi:hypothetical protein